MRSRANEFCATAESAGDYLSELECVHPVIRGDIQAFLRGEDCHEVMEAAHRRASSREHSLSVGSVKAVEEIVAFRARDPDNGIRLVRRGCDDRGAAAAERRAPRNADGR